MVILHSLKVLVQGKTPLVITSIGTVIAIIVVNETEEYRMKLRLQKGLYGVQNVPINTSNEKFSQYHEQGVVPLIETYFETSHRFVGLIGVKCTGKSNFLSMEAHKYHHEKKVCTLFCRIESNRYSSLAELIYDRMYRDIYTLPWLLRQLRIRGSGSGNISTSEETVHRILNEVARQNGHRVHVFIDINSDDLVNITDNVPSNLMEGRVPSISSPQTLNASAFVREVKRLVQDLKLIHCMFACSEGPLFDYESQREGRMKLFRTHELSIAMSKLYLQDHFGYDCQKEFLLTKFPRRFDTLDDFGIVPNKQAYMDDMFQEQMKLVSRAIKQCSKRTWTQWIMGISKEDPISLCLLALKRDIDFADIVEVGHMTENQFVKIFLGYGLFCPTQPIGSYTFQFDVTRDAARRVLESK